MAEQRSTGGRRSEEREQAWRQLFAEHAQCRLSVARFCRERGIASSGFYFWRNEIARRDAERNTTPSFNETSIAKSAMDFAEVEVTKPKLSTDSIQQNATPILIHLAHDCRVEVPVGFDAPTLREIIRVLRGESC